MTVTLHLRCIGLFVLVTRDGRSYVVAPHTHGAPCVRPHASGNGDDHVHEHEVHLFLGRTEPERGGLTPPSIDLGRKVLRVVRPGAPPVDPPAAGLLDLSALMGATLAPAVLAEPPGEFPRAFFRLEVALGERCQLGRQATHCVVEEATGEPVGAPGPHFTRVSWVAALPRAELAVDIVEPDGTARAVDLARYFDADATDIYLDLYHAPRDDMPGAAPEPRSGLVADFEAFCSVLAPGGLRRVRVYEGAGEDPCAPPVARADSRACPAVFAP